MSVQVRLSPYGGLFIDLYHLGHLFYLDIM